MPDTKITALTALTAADPANDVLPIVDVSDTTMAASGTTKKISINNVLGCSGTATLASATISGDLTVDTSTLKVDSVNNRVGIGTATPARPLDIVGSFQSSLGWVLTGTPAGLGAATRYIGGASTTDSWYYNAVTGGSHLWAFGESQAMRLDSTGLGVGVSPDFKFAVNGTQAVPDTTGSSTTNGSLRIGAPGTGLVIDTGVTAAAAVYGWIQARARTDYSSNFNLVLQPNGGNVGIGVTPSAWVTLRGLQNGRANLVGYVSNSEGAWLTNNAFYDGIWKYQTSAQASHYQQLSGAHSWSIAGTGTAGTAITFTQAMTLDASGNLLVAATSTSLTTGTGLKILQNSGVTTVGTVGSSSSDVDTTYRLYSSAASAYRFYVGYGGTVYATNTTISAISDARLKENVHDIDVGLGAILALKPRKFDWKAGKGKDIKGDRGFIAQEFEQVFPQLVDQWADEAPEGEAPYKSVRQDLIPVLVKAIQELTARVQTLETR